MIIEYEIVLKSQMGPKSGIISICHEGGTAEGTLECLGKKHAFLGKITDGGSMKLEGIFQSPLGDEPFSIEGQLTETNLEGKFKRHQECYEILGNKIYNQDGGKKWKTK